MGIIIDFIIITIVGVSTFLAYKKGLVKLAIGLCSFVIATVATFVLYQPISNLVINSTGIDEAIENSIFEKANDIMQENKKEEKLTSQMIETAKNEMLPETARTLAINIVRGGVIIILFITIKISIRFISAIADSIAKLPIINQVNKTGGIIYGLLRGILILYVAFLIICIPEKINPNNKISENINQSFIAKAMYQNNILNVFF